MNSKICSSFFFLFLLPVFQVLCEEVRKNPVCSEGKNCCLGNSSKEYRCPDNSKCCDNQDGCCPREIRPLEKTLVLRTEPVHEVKKYYGLKVNVYEMRDTKYLKKTLGLKKSWNSIHQSHFCPGRKQKCPSSFTCCLFKNRRYGCCPYPGAICCSDMIHCCPRGSKCSDQTKACVPI